MRNTERLEKKELRRRLRMFLYYNKIYIGTYILNMKI